MQLHNVKRNVRNKKQTLVGRGGKRGKTSGRGTKGQNARAGRKKRPELRDIIKKIPKLRGHKFNSYAKDTISVSLEIIQRAFSKGGVVSPKTLIEKGLIKKQKGYYPRIKILGDGAVTSKFDISGCKVSKSALEKIKKAGGTYNTTEPIKEFNKAKPQIDSTKSFSSSDLKVHRTIKKSKKSKA